MAESEAADDEVYTLEDGEVYTLEDDGDGGEDEEEEEVTCHPQCGVALPHRCPVCGDELLRDDDGHVDVCLLLNSAEGGHAREWEPPRRVTHFEMVMALLESMRIRDAEDLVYLAHEEAARRLEDEVRECSSHWRTSAQKQEEAKARVVARTSPEDASLSSSRGE